MTHLMRRQKAKKVRNVRSWRTAILPIIPLNTATNQKGGHERNDFAMVLQQHWLVVSTMLAQWFVESECSGDRGWEFVVFDRNVSAYNFTESREHCWSLGRDLVSIHNESQNEAIYTSLRDERYWIGLVANYPDTMTLNRQDWHWVDHSAAPNTTSTMKTAGKSPCSAIFPKNTSLLIRICRRFTMYR